MSFKKPFRAEPVVLGEYELAKEARERRLAAQKGALQFVAVAVLTFAVGMAIAYYPSWKGFLPRMESPVSQSVAGQQNQGSVYFPDCDAAREAGVAPMYRGTSGYRPGLDADGDGIACEPYYGQ